MVPWHLQPRYGCHDDRPGRETGKKRKNKKQRAQRRKAQLKVDCVIDESGEGGRGEEGEGGEWGLDTPCLSDNTPAGERGEETVDCGTEHPSCESVNPGTTSHVTSEGDHMTSAIATPTLKAQGYQTFHRYYHVFKTNELSALFSRVGGVRVIEEFYDHDNWCVVAEKMTS